MKSKKLIIGIVVAIILATSCVVLANTGNPFNKYDQHIKLGYKYLENENYEEAILEFTKAIEIDVKNTKSYIGLAKTYITRLDENAIEDTSNILKDGYEQTQSEDIVNSFLENVDQLLNNNKIDEALDLLNKGYEITTDEKLNEKKEQVLHKINFDLLENIFNLYENNEIDKIKEIMKTEEYKKASNYTSIENPLIYIKDDTGKGIGIYGQFLYLGDYINKKREGNGIWLGVWDIGTSIYTGEWKNDMPNGEGKLIRTDPNTITEETGSLVNGLFHGEFRESTNGEEPFIVNYNNGIPDVFEIRNDGFRTFYMVGKRDDGATMGFEASERLFGIFGFTYKHDVE